MGYSIFEGTMADLTWQEFEALAGEDTAVLMPLGVIEEHGPHLPLGTDCYGSYQMALCVKKSLEEQGSKCVIAPPFYWGINRITGAFPGSFTVRPETMKALLSDLFRCLKEWGFRNIYCFNCHGDSLHIKTILEAIRTAREEANLNIRLVLEDYALDLYQLSGEDGALLPVSPEMNEELMGGMEGTGGLDIHAGAYETAVMKGFFSGVVREELAETLPDTSLREEDLPAWNEGGTAMRELLPLGYAGNPAGYTGIPNIRELEGYLDSFSAAAIRKDMER